MKVIKLYSSVLIILLIFPAFSFSQTALKLKFNSPDIYKNITIDISRDTIIPKSRRSTTLNVGGIFIAPMFGASYPIGDLALNSKGAFNYGFRIEYASTKLYPFVIAGFLEFQKFPGKDEYKSQHLLDVFETKTVSFGGNIDILLSKYLKSNFTTPFIILELRTINAKRNATPVENVPSDIALSESQIAYGGGAGFTLFIFDLSFKYLKSRSYGMVLFNTRFHIPLIKF